MEKEFEPKSEILSIPHSRPWIIEEDKVAIQMQLQSEMLAKGSKVREFEGKLCEYLQLHFVKTTNSGTSALILALMALGVTSHDEVIIPTYVCQSVANAVEFVGARPVLCDIGRHWNMTMENVIPKISKKTKAIIIVHIFGIAAETEKFKQLNIPLIEDYCQAFGKKIGEQKTGIGDISVFSFHATKCLTTGEGGAVATNSLHLMEQLNLITQKNKVFSNMSDLQASLGINQLKRYDNFLEARNKIAKGYFSGFPKALTQKLHKVCHRSMFFRFPITTKSDFDHVKSDFYEKGIAVRRGVDALLHRNYGMEDNKFPHATNAFYNTISVPIYPGLGKGEVEKIITSVNSLA